MRPERPMTNANARSRRRGVTLLEMLVTVALLLLMMVTIVAIFQAATGAVSVSRAYTLLDQDLRRLDVTLRQDLAGVTCKMTPPNNPKDNVGYFEYAENALSDPQDEDSDDTLRFTAKAPDGRPFTGRIWVPKRVPPTDPGYAVAPTPTTPGRGVTLEPVPVTSQYAEIIYFLRGSKLYRRVRLILPKFTSPAVGNTPSDPAMPGDTAPIRTGASRFGFATNLFEPFALFPATFTVGGFPFVSWQGLNDLSCRPSDFNINFAPNAQPASSYVPISNSLGDLTDRQNRFASPRFANDYLRPDPANPGNWLAIPDGIPDDVNGDGVVDLYPTMYFNSKNAGLVNDTFNTDGSFGMLGVVRPLNRDRSAFPFLFPNPYSQATQAAAGPIHSIDPSGASFNHNPLLVGDSIATPGQGQTWWGFPTWRETMAPTWLDPIKRINDPSGSSFFSDPAAMALGEQPNQQFRGLSAIASFSSPFWLPPQLDVPFSDGVPGASQNNFFDLGNAPVFEDDLIASNVRSFNIKAFDPNPRFINANGVVVPMLPGYYDLGYVAGINPTTGAYDPNYASGATLAPTITGTNPYLLDTLGHEGRMPPLIADNRDDAQFPGRRFNNGNLIGLGDDDNTIARMRRTWDSWSTTYTIAPALPIDPTMGPLNGLQAVVPSYPAPYAAPLRGIEIQIRITDPDSKYVKTLTVRQDFSDKL